MLSKSKIITGGLFEGVTIFSNALNTESLLLFLIAIQYIFCVSISITQSYGCDTVIFMCISFLFG